MSSVTCIVDGLGPGSHHSKELGQTVQEGDRVEVPLRIAMKIKWLERVQGEGANTWPKEFGSAFISILDEAGLTPEEAAARTEEELGAIDGVGPKRLERLMEYLEGNEPGG